MSHTLGFGKHASRTLEWILFNDPGYPWWMIKKGAESRLVGSARSRFDTLIRRAKHLRVPGGCKHCGEPVERMALTRHVSGGLSLVEFFCGQCHYDSGVSGYVTPAFYTPDFFRPYDKTGGVLLVRSIKQRFYGVKPPRMTQKVMEQFFDTPDNFVDF